MGERQFSRIAFDRHVTLKIGDSASPAEIENISLKGALLKTGRPFNLQDVVILELPLSGEPDPRVLTIEGTVVRCEQNKAAVHFTRMDPDSFVLLKNIMAYNQGDEAIVRGELADYLSGKG
ncbi:MAG: PilZ domain-containing protein [Syntrophus sp. (in: bacteria)]|jgi:hypothetical protein|nr:PilZ domain-containing protein [Syntrophus sp. (in: bacteria)]